MNTDYLICGDKAGSKLGNLLERQREGIAIAVREGKYKGRKEVCIKDFSKHYDRYMSREVSKAQLAKELKVSRPTLDKLILQHEG